VSTEPRTTSDPRELLGYLLKHATAKLMAKTDEALAPFGVDGKEFGALRVLAHGEPQSQLQVARTLGVDRTTMVALLDALERRGTVTRRPDPADRRRNVVELTDAGRQTYRDASAAFAAAEAEFLEGVGPRAAAQLSRTLRALLDG